VKSERASFATTALDEAGIPLFAASMLEPSEIIIGVWRPSIAWIALRSARGVSVLIVITLLAAATVGWAQHSWEWLVLQAGAVLVCARIGAAGAEWASRVYVLTDRRVLRRRGVLAPTVYSANLNSLQRVELLQTRIDRALRSGTITFSSRHDGQYDAAWVMVPSAGHVLALIEETRRRYRR
jgi:hypothetical protein